MLYSRTRCQFFFFLNEVTLKFVDFWITFEFSWQKCCRRLFAITGSLLLKVLFQRLE